jgi:hypothetical protein
LTQYHGQLVPASGQRIMIRLFMESGSLTEVSLQVKQPVIAFFSPETRSARRPIPGCPVLDGILKEDADFFKQSLLLLSGQCRLPQFFQPGGLVHFYPLQAVIMMARIET